MKIINSIPAINFGVYIKETKTTHPNPIETINKEALAKHDEFIRSTIPDINSNTSITGGVQIADSLAQNLKHYKIMEEILNQSSPLYYCDTQRVLSQFFERMYSLENNKGFKSLSGYDDVKDLLLEQFVIKVMAMDKTKVGAKVPNAFLFYGPTGCGKTSFAQALAEQSLSNVVTIEPSVFPEETMEEVMKQARLSKENYEKSGDDQTRTIIILNEAELPLSSDPGISDKTKEFFKTCADKYKCTIFLTSNFPLDMDESIFSKDITPFKVLVDHADKETAKKIIEDRILLLNKPMVDINKIVDKLFAQEKGYYSNTQLVSMVDRTGLNNNFPELQDYMEVIDGTMKHPSITQESIEQYKKEEKILKAYNS